MSEEKELTLDISTPQQQLFATYKLLGLNISDLGCIVQNDISKITPKDMILWTSNVQSCAKVFADLCNMTTDLIISQMEKISGDHNDNN